VAPNSTSQNLNGPPKICGIGYCGECWHGPIKMCFMLIIGNLASSRSLRSSAFMNRMLQLPAVRTGSFFLGCTFVVVLASEYLYIRAELTQAIVEVM